MNDRVMALELVKIVHFKLVLLVTRKPFDLVIKLYRSVTQHLKLCAWGFACAENQEQLSYGP